MLDPICFARIIFGWLSQTCLDALYQVRFFITRTFGHSPRALCQGEGAPWYGTSAQPESHSKRSSRRCAPRVVPSTVLLNDSWPFLRGLGREEGGGPWYGTFAKLKGHFTEGMFEKC